MGDNGWAGLPGRNDAMNHAFDPLNLLLLAVAVVVFWKLRSVLGTRTGHEKTIEFPPVNDKPSPAPRQEPAPAAEQEEGVRIGLPEEEKPVWEGVAEEGSKLARVLEAIKEKDPAFSAQAFLDGARKAYEMIVTAFAEGDTRTLKPLLSPEVFAGFRQAIQDRKQRGETLDLTFIGLDDARIVDGELKGTLARLTVRFVSQIITVTRDSEGRIVDGDPNAVTEVIDVWTFERDVSSSDPNWTLIATESPEQEDA